MDLRLGSPWWEEATKVRDAPGVLWFTVHRLEDTLCFMLVTLYAVNGGVVRKQQRGVPMGLECSLQPPNLYAYAVEWAWVERTNPTNVLMRRYIDDIIVMGPDALTPSKGLPTKEEQGAAWPKSQRRRHKTTSSTSYGWTGTRMGRRWPTPRNWPA